MMISMRLSVSLEGVVQGVGMRPFVHSLATRLGLVGFVRNDGLGVTIEVEGEADRVRAFVDDLTRRSPPLAVIDRLSAAEIPARHDTTFSIEGSATAERRSALVPADTATCNNCLRELFRDPGKGRDEIRISNCATYWTVAPLDLL